MELNEYALEPYDNHFIKLRKRPIFFKEMTGPVRAISAVPLGKCKQTCLKATRLKKRALTHKLIGQIQDQIGHKSHQKYHGYQ